MNKVRRQTSEESMKRTLLSCLLKVEFTESGSIIESVDRELEPFFNHAGDARGKFISKDELYLLVIDYVFTELVKEDRHSLKGKLSAVLSNDELQGIATSIVNYVFSLPREYRVFVELPALTNQNAGRLNLSHTVTAVEVFGARSGNPTLSALGALAGWTTMSGALDQKVGSIAGGFFLVIKAQGHALNFDSVPVLEAINKLKQALGLLYDSGSISFNGHLHDSIVPRVFLYDCLSPDGPKEITIPPPLMHFLGKVKLKDVQASEVPPEDSLSRLIEGSHFNTTNKGKELLKFSDKAKTIIDSNIDNPNATYIKNALAWYLDSLINYNDRIMAFIQLAIALESLLGDDSNKTGKKTDILAERCSMLVGRTIMDRRDTRISFRLFYELRSEIVHGEVAKLNREKMERVYWARGTFLALLRREMQFNAFDPPSLKP